MTESLDEAKPRGPFKGCFLVIFIIVMLMYAVYVFFEPVWDRLMEIITGQG